MTGVLDALERYEAAARILMGGMLGLAVDPAEILAPILSAVTARESERTLDARPSRSVLDEAKRAWQTSGERAAMLTTRQIRALCWDSESATNPGFVASLADHPDLAKNRRWIEGLVDSYLARWRPMPVLEHCESVLRKAVTSFRGRSERIALYQPVASQIFSADAPQWLATRILDERRPLNETLREWRIDRSSGLGEAAANAAVVEWTHRFSERKQSLVGAIAYGWFRQLTEELLSSELVGARTIADAVSAIVLWDQAELDDKIRRDLRTFLLGDRRFGDPRLPNRQTTWDLCSHEARQRAIGWLAKEDLLFFFNFVIRDDPHGRRDFWLRYIGDAVDAHVALSEEDAARLRAEVKERPLYARVIGQQSSAFMMRFRGAAGDLLCIEFSKTGNALYIHDANQFYERYQTLWRKEFHLQQELKNPHTKINSIDHHRGWKYKAQSFLTRRGIRPA